MTTGGKNTEPGRPQRKEKETRKKRKREAGTQRQGPGHQGPETKEGKTQGGAEEGRKKREKKGEAKANKRPSKGEPQPRGSSKAKGQSRHRKGEAHQNAPGRPASPTRPRRARTRTDARDPGVASSDPQGEVSAYTRDSPDAPIESPVEQRTVRETGRVSDRVHTRKPPQRTQPTPALEGPARDNRIAGPRTGTMRSETSAPVSAGASGRHNEPGSRPASAGPAQPPSKPGAERSRGGERHHGVEKADRSTKSDRTGQGAAQDAGSRGTRERHAAGHNQGTQTGSKEQQRPSATTLDIPHNTQRTRAQEPVPINISRRLDGRVRTWQPTKPLPATEQPLSRLTCARPRVHNPCWLRNSRCPDERVRAGGCTAPAGYKKSPSRWTCARLAAPPSKHNTAHPACTLVNRSQVAQDAAHRTHSTAHRARTPVNRSQVAQDTAPVTRHAERAHW